jgi:hypothetical protein
MLTRAAAVSRALTVLVGSLYRKTSRIAAYNLWYNIG